MLDPHLGLRESRREGRGDRNPLWRRGIAHTLSATGPGCPVIVDAQAGKVQRPIFSNFTKGFTNGQIYKG